LHIEQRPDNKIIVVEEMVTAGSLRLFLHTFNNLKLKVCQSWFLQILNGLIALHSGNLFHGNLTCEHIYINTNIGELKIGDFIPEILKNIQYKNRPVSASDIRNFGVVMLEIALTQLFTKRKRLKIRIYKLYEEKDIEKTKSLTFKLLNYISDKDFYSLVETCLNSEQNMISIPDLLRHPFFSNEYEGSLDSILATSEKRSFIWHEKGNVPIEQHKKSSEKKESLSIQNIEMKVVKNTMADTSVSINNSILDITLRFCGLNSEKTISFSFDMQKENIFQIAEEMKREKIIPDNYVEVITNQIQKLSKKNRFHKF